MRRFLNTFVIPISIFFLICFTACSGHKGEKPSSDAEGVLGRTEKTYFAQTKQGRTLAIQVDQLKRRIIRLDVTPSTTLSEMGEISFEKVRITQDGKYLTVFGEDQIYEYDPAQPTQVAHAEVKLPSPTIDLLCQASPLGTGALLSGTSIRELRVLIESGGYSFLIIDSNGARNAFDTTALAQKFEQPSSLIYSAHGVGELHISKNEPQAADPSFYASYVNALSPTSIPWASVTNLVCHLNNVAVPKNAGTVLTASSVRSPTNFSSPIDFGLCNQIPCNTFANPENAGLSDSVFTTQNVGNNGAPNMPLIAKGLGFSIPLAARIDGIVVEVEHKASQANLAYVSSITIGTSTNRAEGISYKVPTIATYKSYGSPSDLWGRTLRPSDLNSPDFEIKIIYGTTGGAVLTSVDHIRMTVYYTQSFISVKRVASIYSNDGSNGGTSLWGGLGNISIFDTLFSTTSLGSGLGLTSQYLKATDFGFSVPNGATIVDALVEVNGTSADSMKFKNVKLFKAPSVGETEGNTGSSLGPAAVSRFFDFGLGQLGWVPGDFNTSEFGFYVSVEQLNPNRIDTFSINFISVTVFYINPN